MVIHLIITASYFSASGIKPDTKDKWWEKPDMFSALTENNVNYLPHISTQRCGVVKQKQLVLWFPIAMTAKPVYTGKVDS